MNKAFCYYIWQCLLHDQRGKNTKIKKAEVYSSAK